MDAYKLLRLQAQEKRNKAIKAARDEYNATLVEIRKLSFRVTGRGLKRKAGIRKLVKDGKVPFPQLQISEAVALLLRDSKLTIRELTVEIQARGIRSNDDPRRVAHAIRGTLLYHRGRYKRDRAGRWEAITD